MLTFTLTVVVALLGLIGLAVGYWLGYRTGYTDGVEDALGTEDKWTPLQEGNAPYGLSGGYTADSIRRGTLPEGWPSRERVNAALVEAQAKGWEGGIVQQAGPKLNVVQNGGHHTE